MKKGLVLGKFMPVHSGHVGLINWATEHCDSLIVLVCVSELEPIPGNIRFEWIKALFKENDKITPVLFEFDEKELPNTSVSSVEVSKLWAEKIKTILPDINIIFSSEPYGQYLADFLAIENKLYDQQRKKFPISATEIRTHPLRCWQFIPEIVRPFFVRKICIVGTESTGKSTLVKKLAEHYKTEFVSEAGRDMVAGTTQCEFEDLYKIATEHAHRIVEKMKTANKFLFIDTDVNITKSYGRFLFNHNMQVDPWIEEVNECHLYLYSRKDAEFIQDGTRLEEHERNKLDEFHLKQFREKNISLNFLEGSWEDRFKKAVDFVDEYISSQVTIKLLPPLLPFM